MTWSPVQGDHESCPERGVTSLWDCVGDNPPTPAGIWPSCLERFISSFGVPSDKTGEGRGSRADSWRREGKAGGLDLESDPERQGPAPAFPRCVALDRSSHVPELWFLFLSLEVNKQHWCGVGETGK